MKKMVRIVSTFLLLLALSGCAASNGHDTLNAKDKPLTWQEKKEKPFGKFEYRKLDEAEAKKLLTDKFLVELPQYYEDINIVFNKHFETEASKLEPIEYSITTNGENLYFRAINRYSQNEELKIFTYIDFEYQFDREKKQATLKNQTIMIANPTQEGQFPKNDFEETVKDLSSLVNINIGKNLEDLQTLRDKEKGKLGGAVLQVYENTKDAKAANELQKSIAVELNEQEHIIQTFFYITDTIDEDQ